MLAAVDVEASALREHFAESIKDVTLFEKLTGSDSVFISCDLSQTTRAVEAKALKQCGVTAIYFGPFWNKLLFWQQAVWLISRWQRIDGFASGVARGTFAEVKQNGRAVPFML